MKTVPALIVSSLFLAATAGQALASTVIDGQQTRLSTPHQFDKVEVLDAGWSNTHLISQGHPDRFLLHVSHPQAIAIKSVPYAGDTQSSYRITAKVYDQKHHLVAAATPNGQGNFALTQSLDAGDYLIKVHGLSFDHDNATDANYQLQVDYL
ncbi:hypothetical protein [Larsenimonas suaedae]|uniref:DUF4198 domain-containing protein n=1 Tax=Larsenimonas suaedae TaxID=1851019 RepID=A0ABU1GZF3_9GAMM|nr:hypothetical protein [Larsenimonas suaedae]MCM2971427.1 hypothetical protein [Larsenimonas suaedae]MDR5896683.1 hypothetical protein [Larsenimonas suaedae]